MANVSKAGLIDIAQTLVKAKAAMVAAGVNDAVVQQAFLTALGSYLFKQGMLVSGTDL